MSRLYLQPTTMAHWHALVNEAEIHCAMELTEDLESYLVFLLMRFSERPEMVKSVMALEFLEGMNAVGSRKHELLKEVGDKCLLYTGLFPEQIKRRRLRSSYYIDLGQNAYYALSSLSNTDLAGLYSALTEGFLAMRQVLCALRQEGHSTITFEKEKNQNDQTLHLRKSLRH